MASLGEQEKWAQDVDVEKGKMRRVLDIDADEEIEDQYTSGQELAKDLLNAVGDVQEVNGMLAFAANVQDDEDNIFARAHRLLDDAAEDLGMREEAVSRNKGRIIENLYTEKIETDLKVVQEQDRELSDYQEFVLDVMDYIEIESPWDLNEDGRAKFFSFLESHWDDEEDETRDPISKSEVLSFFDEDDFKQGKGPDGDEFVNEGQDPDPFNYFVDKKLNV